MKSDANDDWQQNTKKKKKELTKGLSSNGVVTCKAHSRLRMPFLTESPLLSSVLFCSESALSLSLSLQLHGTDTRVRQFAQPRSPPTAIEFASPSIFMEFGIDGSINGETIGHVTIGEVSSSIADENKIGSSSFDPAYKQDQDDNITQDSSGDDTIPSAIPAVSVVSADEPYIGQEFESEAAAHAFYNTYATRVGFIIRVSKLSRSRRDGSAIGRALVCNKEGYRMADKREKIVRQRAETRVGCRAMILVRKVSSGKWVVTKFVKEHTHPLTPGKGRRDCIYEQYPNEHDKIRELSQQLAIEKKRSAAYKRHLELLFQHIEEHNDSLSKKIQHIVESVKEIEATEQQSHR